VTFLRPPTSGPLERASALEIRHRGSHLTNWINVIGKREVFLIFDFAVLSRKFRYRSHTSLTAWSEAEGSSYTGHEVDALAPRADEGRGRLRKAPGSREQTLYPEMSEWGNPTGEVQFTPG
jgi:hypothetical protein